VRQLLRHHCFARNLPNSLQAKTTPLTKPLQGMFKTPVQSLAEVYMCKKGLFWGKRSFSDVTVLCFSKMQWFHEHLEATTYSTTKYTKNIKLLLRIYENLLLKSLYTGLVKMIFGVLTTCHIQYTWERSVCVFLFNRTTLQVFVTYLTGALYVHLLWFYKYQHDNRVRSKLFVACQRWLSIIVLMFVESQRVHI